MNFREALTDFNQGHQPDGNARKPKFNYPTWKQNFILKNNDLYVSNREFIDDWLARAKQNPLFLALKQSWSGKQGKHAIHTFGNKSFN